MIHLQDITNAGKDVDGELWQCTKCGVARPTLKDWVCDCPKRKKAPTILRIQYQIIEDYDEGWE